ncbi:MAG: Gfo/Idh/MocA family oxidoreductase [Planctomycetes bacterium]|nr:Gfo/Idh/MocA family oxidoreductase [Planctomycetota bacterium]
MSSSPRAVRSSANSLTRRRFLKTSAVAAATTFAAPAILRAKGVVEKLNVAVIGAGGRGGSNLGEVAKTENIVMLCDVNQGNLDRAASAHPKARTFVDYRKLFDRPNEFDAVVVSTCEHTHAFATLAALQNGKHVYCEKPLTHSIWEARVIREAAAKARVATQMGIQIHSLSNYRRVVELIQTGAIGPVREAHVWVSRAWGWQSPEDAKAHGDIVSTQNRPQDSSPVPAGLDWDLWLGPAPERPFHNVYFPGPKWYRWWEWGSGTMSDLGSHWNDLPFWALNLQAPLTIEAAGPPAHPDLAPASMQATYEYGPRGDMPAVKLTWYQGVNKPRIWTEKGIPQWDSAALFIGDKGMLLSDYSKHLLLPEDQFKDFKRPDPFLPESPGQQAEWVRACKTDLKTTCNFEYSGWLTEANHLGNVAYRVGKKIEWDAANLRCPNAPEAAGIIQREYRKGWKLV